MTLVVLDGLPFFWPLDSETLEYDKFVLLVKEEEFLKDPIGSLDAAVSALSFVDLKRKLGGLRLMQRIVVADRSDSLFVPAFAREIVESMKE